MLISSEHRQHHLEAFKQSDIQAISSNPLELHGAIKATLSFLNKIELQLTHYYPQTLRAMVIDDSRLARKAITKALRNLELNETTESKDDFHATSDLTEHEAELVIIDYNMPEVNRIEQPSTSAMTQITQIHLY